MTTGECLKEDQHNELSANGGWYHLLGCEHVVGRSHDVRLVISCTVQANELGRHDSNTLRQSDISHWEQMVVGNLWRFVGHGPRQYVVLCTT
jgi:hypothetical protein